MWADSSAITWAGTGTVRQSPVLLPTSVKVKRPRFNAVSFRVQEDGAMPKKIDPKVKERCVQQMLEHVLEYPNPTAAAEVVAKRNGVGTESVRRWYLQAQIDTGQRRGAT